MSRLVAAVALALAVLVAPAGAGTPAPGFTDTAFVSGLNFPTALAFLPDGRLIIAEKGGFAGVSGGVAQNQQIRTADVAPGGGLTIDGVSSFAEDARGEIYIVSHGNFAAGAGAVYRIEAE